ncbi:helix-turn-helix domain-containing protein [Sphingosinicella rhizophila]|uniref:XRE family transcriptional regulator n=1 Tax=Sphingosinicella rhizophila TaxID=3050082 RepID=A0ABU3QAF2_9SPHN|nr:XRE family transcriptional regulator [Sphingosinicella sp. GR2756]MDT9600368.1 XRE family transcriptional regulator [Sphingosinicella sp. GR2756]
MLKSFRTERGLTLADVSQRTGLTASTLSKIENGKMELTIDKLVRISLALEINIADVFGTPTSQYASEENSRRRSITRAGDGKQVSSASGTFRYQAYDLLNKGITPIVADVTAKSLEEFGEFHRHNGEEYVYVLEGELALYTDTYTPAYLKAGDSIYFDSDMGHAYIAVGDVPCRILVTFSSSDAEVVNLMEGHTRPVHMTGQARRVPA